MAIILIEPVAVKTKGGHSARITGIDPTDHDFLHGKLSTSRGEEDACWNASGLHRDGGEPSNLVRSDDEVQDVIETARRLGAQG